VTHGEKELCTPQRKDFTNVIKFISISVLKKCQCHNIGRIKILNCIFNGIHVTAHSLQKCDPSPTTIPPTGRAAFICLQAVAVIIKLAITDTNTQNVIHVLITLTLPNFTSLTTSTWRQCEFIKTKHHRQSM